MEHAMQDFRQHVRNFLGMPKDGPTLAALARENRAAAGLKDGPTRRQVEARAAQRAHGEETRAWLVGQRAAAVKRNRGTAMARAMRLVDGRRVGKGSERVPEQMRGLVRVEKALTMPELGTVKVQARDAKTGARKVDRKGRPVMREVTGNRAQRRAEQYGHRPRTTVPGKR